MAEFYVYDGSTGKLFITNADDEEAAKQLVLATDEEAADLTVVEEVVDLR